jgi:hypothetical protein
MGEVIGDLRKFLMRVSVIITYPGDELIKTGGICVVLGTVRNKRAYKILVGKHE